MIALSQMQKIVLLLILSLATACGSSDKKHDVEVLQGEVLDIHDAIMPEMGVLRNTGRELEALADSLMSVDSTKAKSYLEIADKLRNANEGMMIWMRNYEHDFEGTDEEKEKYLLKQKERIQRISDNMTKTLKEGVQVLTQLNQ